MKFKVMSLASSLILATFPSLVWPTTKQSVMPQRLTTMESTVLESRFEIIRVFVQS